jgi:hypothetical protein
MADNLIGAEVRLYFSEMGSRSPEPGCTDEWASAFRA